MKILCTNDKQILLLLCIMVIVAPISSCTSPALESSPISSITVIPTSTILPLSSPVFETPSPEFSESYAMQWPTENWPVSTPEEQGIDSRSLRAMFTYVRDGNFGLNSLLIVRNGFLVAEGYYAPFQSDNTQHLFSATKSVISILVGMAIQDGYIRSVDQSVFDFFPEITPAMLDERKQQMTIAHLLKMTSGLDWREVAPYNGDSMAQMIASSNWVEFVLTQPMAHIPGKVFCYNSGASHLLSALLQRATGVSTLAYAQARLFKPLGISTLSWGADPQGTNIGGWGLSLTTRDMAKLGYLYLRRGLWDGVQLVPADWVTVSTTWQTASMGLLEGWGYGYLWWLIPDLPYKAFEARGLLGQHIVVIPELDLVVVFTSRAENRNAPIEILKNYLIPSVQSVAPLSPNREAYTALHSLLQEIAHAR